MLTHTLTIQARLTLPDAAMDEVRALATQLLPDLEARLAPWRLVSRAFSTAPETLILDVVVAADLDLPADEAHAEIEAALKPRLAELFTAWAWASPAVTSAALTWGDDFREGA